MSPPVVEYPSREAMAETVAARIAQRLLVHIRGSGEARLAVPGGSTPGPMLNVLGAASLPWTSVAVTVTDERLVPEGSPRSNRRLLAETLLRGPAAAARFVPLCDALDAAAGARPATALERRVLPLDVAVLGMGADMHTASLFPGADGLAEALAADAPSVVAIRSPAVPEPRVSLSARVLREAGERHIVIVGPDKRAALERALAIADPRVAPVCAVLADATVHYAA